MDLDTYIVTLATLYSLISVFAGVVVHELGHLFAARFLTIQVLSVSIGFGPEIVGFTDRHGVRWKLAPLIVGGSCSFQEQPRGREHTNAVNLRSLCEASPKDRVIVLLAGPAFNLCFAGLIWLIFYFHNCIFPSLSEVELMLGLPAFLVTGSCAIALFNLLPIPPLDGGYLSLVLLEVLRGRALSYEKQLVRVSAWVITVVTVIASVLLLPQIATSLSQP